MFKNHKTSSIFNKISVSNEENMYFKFHIFFLISVYFIYSISYKISSSVFLYFLYLLIYITFESNCFE